MKNNAAACSLAVAVFFLTACSGFGSASSVIGSKGGSVSLGSALTVTVPPGSVDDGTVITVTEVEPRNSGDREFEIQPDGLELKHAAEVEVEAESESQVTETQNQTEHSLENESFEAESHHMRCMTTALGTITLHGHGADDAADGGTEVQGGMGADDVDGGMRGGGTGGHGGHDSP
jgi:hypothetical protein